MADRGYSAEFKTPPCILGFDKYLLTPEKKVYSRGPKSGEEFQEWGATLIFPTTTDKTPFENAIIEAGIAAKWGDRAKVIELIKAGLIKSPFLAGDGKEARAKKGPREGQLHPGMGPNVWFIRTNTRKAPVVLWKSRNIQATAEEVYSGCHGFAVLNAYTWEGDTGKGVTFGLSMFQKKADGERLGGGAAPLDVDAYYEAIEDTGAAPEATRTGLGAGGLFS